MAGTRSIDYLYRIVDRFSPALEKMKKVATKFDAQVTRIQGSLGRIEDKFKSTGAKVANLQTGLAALGAGAFLKSALDESVNFQKALNMTQAVTGATDEQMQSMRESALGWGASTQFSSGQVAAAMAELGKMGNNVNQIIDLMPGTMALAAAGEIEMAEAANYTMGILNQFGLGLDNAGMVADVLAAGASGAATSVAGISSAMNNAGLAAANAGLTVKDTTKALMAMASKNLEGAEAGTMMMNAMQAMTKMTDKTRKGFEDMGIDIDQFRDATTGQTTDFWGLIEAMQNAGPRSAVVMTEMFDQRQLKAFNAIVGTSAEKLAEYDKVMAGTDGAAKKMQDTLLNGIDHLITFESVTQNLKVMMGAWLNESIAPTVDKFNEWLGGMQKNNPEMLKLITYVLMGITALGAILIPLGLLISAIGSIIGVVRTIIGLTKVWSAVQAVFNAIMAANPIVLIVLGIMALIAAIIFAIKYWDEITAFIHRAWIKIGQFYESIKGLILLFGGPLGVALVVLIESIKLMVRHWDSIKNAFITGWQSISNAFTISVDFIKSGLLGLWDGFMTLLDNPFFTAVSMIIAPWLTIPGLIIKHWEPLKDFIYGIWDKIGNIMTGLNNFGTGVINKIFGAGEELPTAPIPSAPAPTPMGYGTNVNAEASVSVYTEEGMQARPFTPRGNLGYNMASRSTR